jgi:hypothetical protein
MLLRRQLLLTAVMAAVAMWATPAVSQAGFMVDFKVYDTAGDLIGTDTRTTQGSFLNLSSPNGGLAGVAALSQIVFSAQSNQPGVQSAILTDTSVSLVNSGSEALRLVITVSDDRFTTGSAGTPMRIQSLASTNVGWPVGLTNASGVVRTEVTEGGNTYRDYDPTTGLALPPNGSGWVGGDFGSFVRSSNDAYTARQIITLDLGAGGSANFSATSAITTPAPPGLVLAATTVPFVGLLRRRLRKAVPVA